MLGGEELVEIGLGDEQEGHGVREAFTGYWAQEVLEAISPIAIKG